MSTRITIQTEINQLLLKIGENSFSIEEDMINMGKVYQLMINLSSLRQQVIDLSLEDVPLRVIDLSLDEDEEVQEIQEVQEVQEVQEIQEEQEEEEQEEQEEQEETHDQKEERKFQELLEDLDMDFSTWQGEDDSLWQPGDDEEREHNYMNILGELEGQLQELEEEPVVEAVVMRQAFAYEQNDEEEEEEPVTNTNTYNNGRWLQDYADFYDDEEIIREEQFIQSWKLKQLRERGIGWDETVLSYDRIKSIDLHQAKMAKKYKKLEPYKINDVTVIVSSNTSTFNEECPICLNKRALYHIRTQCGHTFCQGCITKTIKNVSNCCPLCRTTMKVVIKQKRLLK